MSHEFPHAELAKRYGTPLRNARTPAESVRDGVQSPRMSPASEFGHSVGRSPSPGIDMTRGPDSGLKPKEQAQVTRQEFELACIREFSHSGHHLGLGVSPAERRERIRAAISRENKVHERWHGSEFTYAEVYAQAYQQKLAVADSDESHASASWRAHADEDFSDDEEALEDGELLLG